MEMTEKRELTPEEKAAQAAWVKKYIQIGSLIMKKSTSI